jgi:manganese transport protein
MAAASPPEEQADAGLTTDTRDAARQALRGRTHGLAALLPFLGPAFIASVAYTDPGNFATNIQAGAQLGYRLLWVVLFANLAAMLFQTLAAKLGIVTGHNLAEVCRERFSRPVVLFMWVISEVAAIATDLAEFFGAVLALKLLLGIPSLAGVIATGVATYLMLLLQRYGFRPIEIIIAGFLGLIGAAYLAEIAMSRPAASGSAPYSPKPSLTLSKKPSRLSTG